MILGMSMNFEIKLIPTNGYKYKSILSGGIMKDIERLA